MKIRLYLFYYNALNFKRVNFALSPFCLFAGKTFRTSQKSFFTALFSSKLHKKRAYEFS